jgi:hypothetical protein
MLKKHHRPHPCSLQVRSQEQYDASVLRPHDVMLARAIATCDDWEWQQRGDWIQEPLDISDRPAEPVIPGGWRCEGARVWWGW